MLKFFVAFHSTRGLSLKLRSLPSVLPGEFGIGEGGSPACGYQLEARRTPEFSSIDKAT